MDSLCETCAPTKQEIERRATMPTRTEVKPPVYEEDVNANSILIMLVEKYKTSMFYFDISCSYLYKQETDSWS